MNLVMPKEKYIEKECKTHGMSKFILEGRGYYRCMKCRSKNVADRRRRVKLILVQERGGKCERCGYDKCIAALDFHHREKSEKEFGISANGSTIAIERLRKEAEKCDLICANCHREVEAELSQVAKLEDALGC